MPRIPAAYVDSVVYLYEAIEAAELNEPTGGCGVIVAVEDDQAPDSYYPYIVTNAHVAKEYRVVKYKTGNGPQYVDLSTAQWFYHPDGWDIAVCPLPLDDSSSHDFFMVPQTAFMTEMLMEEIPLRHGDELFMVSRYVGNARDLDDEPIVRFGTLAKTHPVLREDGDGKDQESFLAEMRSLPGHSGSPTFVYFYGMQARLGADDIEHLPEPGIYMLGIDWSHPSVKRKLLSGLHPGEVFGNFYVEENSGLACIVPAWRIAEILSNDQLKEARQGADTVIVR